MLAIEKEVKEYKTDIKLLEKYVKKWEKEILLKEISKVAQNCYDIFNTLQMDIAKLKVPKEREKYDIMCYKETYGFLAFVENEINTDVYCLLANNVKPFTCLVKHYSKYCSKIEKKYDIELCSEKTLRIKK